MTAAHIALGSNLGDRATNLRTALEMLTQTAGISITAVSAIYETAPVGGPEQDPYLNACAALDTELTPTRLLLMMLDIEEKIGRVRKVRWGPRIIDLDLLLYGTTIMNTPLLELPHPRMSERDFVLIPLADIAPDQNIPGLNRTVAVILAGRPDNEDVKLFLPTGWFGHS
jgi:2-amino-4-hydroxy-6-hydroxymethyldihydropteridine diphosphokinase